MGEVSQVIANGVMTGSIYGLLAVSVALVFGVLDVPQFAFGAHATVGAYATAVLAAHGYWLGVLGAIIALAALGAVVQSLVFDPLRNAPPAMLFVGAFGLLTILQGLALLIWGPDPKVVEPPFSGATTILGASITYHRLLVIAVVIVTVVALNMFLLRTDVGRAIRAASQSRTGALVVGLSPRRIGMLTMALGSALAGLAGALLAPISQVYPTLGEALIIKAFVIVILAGMGSINGAIIGGFVVGLAESLGTAYVSLDYRDAYPLVILLAVLILRPQGIFGRAGRVA